MNKRQRKKLYLKKTGKNPPCRIALRGESYNKVVGFANKTKRPYFKLEIIFSVALPEATVAYEREARIQDIITRLIDRIDRALKLKSYQANTEHVVNLTKVLTRRRKVRRVW